MSTQKNPSISSNHLHNVVYECTRGIDRPVTESLIPMSVVSKTNGHRFNVQDSFKEDMKGKSFHMGYGINAGKESSVDGHGGLHQNVGQNGLFLRSMTHSVALFESNEFMHPHPHSMASHRRLRSVKSEHLQIIF